jgi:hypothetical protein
MKPKYLGSLCSQIWELKLRAKAKRQQEREE